MCVARNKETGGLFDGNAIALSILRNNRWFREPQPTVAEVVIELVEMLSKSPSEAPVNLNAMTLLLDGETKLKN